MLFPAGLFNDDIEIMGLDFKAFALIDGRNTPFAEFPSELRSALENDLRNNPIAQKSLNAWGVPEEEQLERHTFCMWGAFDYVADFTSCGRLQHPEFNNHCGNRGRCEFEGKCCPGLNLKNGKLSPREIEVATQIGSGHPDKYISFQLDISVETLRHHKNSIEKKAGIRGKVAIALLAQKHKLI